MKKALIIVSFLSVGIANAQDLQPTSTEACLTVNVADDKKKPQAGETVTFENTANKKQYSGKTREDGKFKILVPKGATYKLKYRAFSTNVDYSTLTLPVSKDTLVSFDVNIILSLPKSYTLDNVFFDTGKASLRPESSKELNELAEYMLLKKSLVIEIAGHTDNVGVKEANQKLSEDRANMVRDYLLKRGVAADHVVAKGYGDTQPVADNNTDKGKQKNRRTEVRIIKG
ncbi:MAG: OmpA family protein [Bacteroidia bacterium]|nr:OmpA family protein [Bacteroidia bacterium]